MKVGDWRSDAEAPVTSNPTQRKNSATLLMMNRSSSLRRFSSSSSSSSFKQFDLNLPGVSSSSLASNKEFLEKKRPATMGNATWDLQPDDLKVRKTSPTNMFLDGMRGDKAVTRKLSSESSMFALKETKNDNDNATWDEEDLHRFQAVKVGSNEFSVKTFTEKEHTQIDVRQLTSSDLASLKEHDAFMYYSIPGVKGNEFNLEDVKESSPIVTRSTAISFESADLWFEEFEDDDTYPSSNPNEPSEFDDYELLDNDSFISFLYSSNFAHG